MTEDFNILAARVFARAEGRAVLVRSTRSIAPDPAEVLGVAFLRVAAEERVQAVAYGALGVRPAVITVVNPLARTASELEPFARALNSYLARSVREGFIPRVWVGHSSALTVLDMLGHRYSSNPWVDDVIKEMGGACRALCEEATFPGQQVVMVALNLMREHAVTGQSAAEDQHLGAFLAWVNPRSETSNPVQTAGRRALSPAASLLERGADDRVEEMRRELRRSISNGGDQIKADGLRQRIAAILEEGVLREWSLLDEAYQSFWRLDLDAAPTPGIDNLVDESKNRLGYYLANGAGAPARPHSLSLRLDSHDYADSFVEDMDACRDERVRERLRQKGRVTSATVEGVTQPITGALPCTLTLSTTQEIIRARPGTILRTVNGLVEGRVSAIGERRTDGSRSITLNLIKGVRGARRPRPGQALELVDTVTFDPRRTKRKVYKVMRDAGSSIVYDDRLPGAVRRTLPEGDLLEMVEGERK